MNNKRVYKAIAEMHAAEHELMLAQWEADKSGEQKLVSLFKNVRHLHEETERELYKIIKILEDKENGMKIAPKR